MLHGASHRTFLLSIEAQRSERTAATSDLRACCWLSSVTSDQACVSSSRSSMLCFDARRVLSLVHPKSDTHPQLARPRFAELLLSICNVAEFDERSAFKSRIIFRRAPGVADFPLGSCPVAFSSFLFIYTGSMTPRSFRRLGTRAKSAVLVVTKRRSENPLNANTHPAEFLCVK